MADKNIKIDNSNGGIVNIYYGDEEKETSKRSATVRLSAIDKYSSPLEAFIDISPWGEKMYKVSLLVKNSLIGQVTQSNYLFYNEESTAKESYDKIVKLMEYYKDKAERGLVHSAIISQQMRNDMMAFKSDLTPAESSDVYNRFQNNDTVNDLASGIPPGLLLYDPNHFPDHEGIVKQASNKDSILLKIASNIEAGLNNFNRNSIKAICQLTLPELNDSEKVKILKRNALISIKPILSNFNKKTDKWIAAWLKSNERRVKACINDIYAIAFEKTADIKEPDTVDIDRYDFFIFDADKTLWDSTVPAANTIPPYEFATTESKNLDGDCVIDKNGNVIRLKNGIRTVLERLKTMEKVLGLISKSEKQGIPYEDQPVLHLLKKFGILALFDSPIAICQDLPKSIFIPQDINQSRVLFVDDDMKNLIDVDNNTKADVVDIKKIEKSANLKKNWYKTSQLNAYENFNYNWLIQPDISGNYWTQSMHPSVFDENNAENVRMLLRIYSDFNSPEDWTKEKDENILGAWWNKYRPDGWDSPVNFLLTKQQELFNENYANIDSWYKSAKREYIPQSERPDKPKDGKEYELDHKKPQFKFKNKDKANKKENLQWVEKSKHKEKSKNEGSLEYGGKDRHEKLKGKGKKEYSKYQSNAGKEKVKKERESVGEKEFSKIQRDRVNKRWSKEKKKSSGNLWYKVAQENWQNLFQSVGFDKINWYKTAQTQKPIGQPDLFNTPEEIQELDKINTLVTQIKTAIGNIADPDDQLLSDEMDDPTFSPGWRERVRSSYEESGTMSDDADNIYNIWEFITSRREEDVRTLFYEVVDQINQDIDLKKDELNEEVQNISQEENPDAVNTIYNITLPYLENVKIEFESTKESIEEVDFYHYSSGDAKVQIEILLNISKKIKLKIDEAYNHFSSYSDYYVLDPINIEDDKLPTTPLGIIEAIESMEDYEDFLFEMNEDSFSDYEWESEHEYYREKLKDFIRDFYIPESVYEYVEDIKKIEDIKVGLLNYYNFNDLEDLLNEVKDKSINYSRWVDKSDINNIIENINKLKTASLFDINAFKDVLLNPEIGGYDSLLEGPKDSELKIILKIIKDNKEFQTGEVNLPELPDINQQENVESQPPPQPYRGDSLAGSPVIKKQLDALIGEMQRKGDFIDVDEIIPKLVSTGAQIDTRMKSAWIGSNLPRFIQEYNKTRQDSFIRRYRNPNDITEIGNIDPEKVIGGPKALRQWVSHRVFSLGETVHDSLYYLFDEKAQDQPPGLAKFLNLVVNSSKDDIVRYIGSRKAALEKGYPDTPKGINQYQVDRLAEALGTSGDKNSFVSVLIQNGYDDNEIQEFIKDVKISETAEIPAGTWIISNYGFKILEKTDSTGAVLGNIISCCQKIGGVGESCVYDGYENPKSGFMTVYDKANRMVAMSYIKLGNSNSLYLDNIEADRLAHNDGLRQAYLEWAKRIKEERGYSAVYAGCGYTDMRFNTVKHKINIKSEFSSEDEIFDSTDVYSDLGAGAFRIAKKNLEEYFKLN